jgi:hypothetical protein
MRILGALAILSAAGAAARADDPSFARRLRFWWPHAVAAGEDVLFVADRLNRRVVRAKRGSRAEETCRVP